MIIHYLKIAWRNIGGRFCLFRFIHVMDFV